MSRAASWLPLAVADRLCAHDRSEPLLLAWLATLRAQIEEYEIRAPSPEIPTSAESESSNSPDSAFDEILSQLGNEIFKLDEYQRQLTPADERTSVSHSILDLFDECLCDMTATDTIKVGDNSQPSFNGIEESEDESTLSEVSFVTSTPVKVNIEPKVLEVSSFCDRGTSVLSKRVLSQSASSLYSDCNMDVENKPRPTSGVESLASRLETDSDSESTCWSYKDCSTDTENDEHYERYAAVWAHSSGYHNSDQILRRVLAQHHAIESRLSFDVARELPPPSYSIYALPEAEGRCPRSPSPVADMTPGAADGYEPVGDALDENIYEEIEYGGSYTDEGCSCEGSVEVESCSVSASSEAGRESPVYANLKDHDAYAVPPDVIAWRNLLLHPDYNDDEEDVWITPEECAVFAQEPRPPLVIPRISHHRTRALRPHQPFNYTQESPHELRGAKPRQYGLREWSPQMQRPCAPGYSPVFTPPSKRLGGSTENLLVAAARRPNHLPLPASSSDSIDIDVRDRGVTGNRNRKSRSMVVAAKQRLRSPIPAPRMLLRTDIVETPVHEGPVKRTKFAESGKKVRKHWTDCYMILTQTALKCYKDQKTYEATKSPRPAGTPPSPTVPRAELELPLKNGHVVPCNHQHTSRFTRSLLLTVGYNQYLIQDETKDGAKKWFELIHDTIYELGSSTKPAEYSPYQSSNTDLESLGRTPPAVRNPSRVKQKAGGSSNEDLSDTTEVSYVKSRLKKFFAKRPAMQVLVDKGIYKDEPVFGKNLEEVCPSTPPRVPKFVVKCVEEIEKSEENMCTDGLYRASGNLSQVQKIRLEIDQNNLSVIENSPDIHVLTGSLKLFFRELKEPLIPCKFFDRVLAACSIKPREARTKEFREIVRALPACNRDTLKFLLEHLLRVTTYSEKNRMHTANLAIVFGPTLLWAPAEQAHNIALDCIQQNNVVDILLTEFKEIFAEDTGKNKKKA